MKSIFVKANLTKVLIASLDIVLSTLALCSSALFQFLIDYSAVPDNFISIVSKMWPTWILLVLGTFVLFRLYNIFWEYAGVWDAIKVIAASTISTFVMTILSFFFYDEVRTSMLLLLWVLQTIFSLAIRFFYRFFLVINRVISEQQGKDEVKNIMIIGAGNAGYSLIHEIQRDYQLHKVKVACIIDDNPRKRGKTICGAKVVGGINEIVDATQKYNINEIVFAIPSMSKEKRQKYLSKCMETSCVLKTLPSVYQILNNKVSISMLRQVEISDLLGRATVKMDISPVSEITKGKTVLVTGAGGSIGSELCRQIAAFEPTLLILFDIYENNLFYIQNELKDRFPNLNIETVIGSVREAERIEQLFSTYKPEIVFHAAAHKHVPLMEDNPNEAVKNNVFGTFNVVQASHKYDVSRFVLISTDKAVNPTNVMGATKRICEMIVQSHARHSKTQFSTVRFGNVLGSNGSVIPIFKKQIEDGGPVTVTHPDITRYFMTIPEAVCLVLQASAYAKGGEIFVLDMGEPVKVLSLAENMIRLSGHIPYKDIDIAFTGLRPGEKIFEELLMSEEGLAATQNTQIFVGKPIEFDENIFYGQLEFLKKIMYKSNGTDIRSVLHDIVPTYKCPSVVYRIDDAQIPMSVISYPS